ncbi:UDP-N-acetyl-D-mannosamine dehydrogenase [Brevundimonas sp.]|uniref:UDP-N-acetyl-D-mannosamine dehydrogenase n=1 Tax=Brevundimonas sp. TaxID=1871086 RepID=UPI002D47388E|nr:UDP-N-acetyl-D-mannosamine dehydrogenase [Brevundimonas sp.]HYC67405.1 UDP-N-acetyl-D-mannosamine dehydrogenase [Brevundimonas sp.]
MKFKKVCVVGLGYIGLPTAALMASRGLEVVGVDINESVVDSVNRGAVHIVEPRLDAVVQAAVGSGRLRAAPRPETADAFLIAVPTPITADKASDMRAVLSAVDAIAPVLKAGDLVVLESTSPVGTTDIINQRMAAARPDLRFPKVGVDGPDVHVAYCPERVLPGKVIQELVSNDRAIGGMTEACTELATGLYALFVEGELVATRAREAELCKLAENAFRDVNIAYANELANVCDSQGVDVWEVIRLANRHPRVNILNPGPGVGGHCIAVDPWFIVESAPDDTPVIQAARAVNDGRPHRVVEKIRVMVEGLRSPVVACLGLAFKPDIDDLRESPAVDVVLEVARLPGVELLVVEPNINQLPAHIRAAGAELVDLETALSRADAVAVLVDHTPFRQNVDRIAAKDRIVDTRGILSRTVSAVL